MCDLCMCTMPKLCVRVVALCARVWRHAHTRHASTHTFGSELAINTGRRIRFGTQTRTSQTARGHRPTQCRLRKVLSTHFCGVCTQGARNALHAAPRAHATCNTLPIIRHIIIYGVPSSQSRLMRGHKLLKRPESPLTRGHATAAPNVLRTLVLFRRKISNRTVGL